MIVMEFLEKFIEIRLWTDVMFLQTPEMSAVGVTAFRELILL